jgi:hypothetical protein
LTTDPLLTIRVCMVAPAVAGEGLAPSHSGVTATAEREATRASLTIRQGSAEANDSDFTLQGEYGALAIISPPVPAGATV